jgi:alkylation response protein AidB-like acyl-CoA dehydrogenase
MSVQHLSRPGRTTGSVVQGKKATFVSGPHAEIVAVLRRWLDKDVRDKVLEFEHADEYPEEMVEQMREFGLFGATIPEEYGGLGFSASAYAEIVEAISEVWMSLTGILNSHLMMAELIRRHGTNEQRRAILPSCACGTFRGGLALTEPDCGSDLQAIRTQAIRSGDGYVISGAKTWITNAGRGNCLAVLVKTDPTVEPRHRGMSLFFVRKESDYRVLHQLGKLGYKGIDTVELVFEDALVGADQLIGEEEGYGFVQTVGALELGRINVAARGVGIAEAALQSSISYSRDRWTMGKPIGQHQAIQLKLADMACRVGSARLLVREAADVFDRGARCDLEAGMAKLVASEAALENATDALRIHGAYGYSTEGHVERYFRDAPLLCIGEGTNEIQRLVIARHLLSR